MRLIPKQIIDEEFIYSSTLSEDDLIAEIKETLKKAEGFNFSVNLMGNFISDDTFQITSKWQFGTYRKMATHSDTTLTGKISKKNKTQSQIHLIVTPHSLFPTFFLLLPILFITLIFVADKKSLDSESAFEINLLFGILALLTPPVTMFLSNFSKKRLRDRFVRQFNLTFESQLY